MKKLLFVLPLFFLFLIPNDTFALEYQNPRMEIWGLPDGSNTVTELIGCEACGNIQNTSGTPQFLRIYLPASIFEGFTSFDISFDFTWVYNSMYDVWPRPPIMFLYNGVLGSTATVSSYTLTDWTYQSSYMQSGYWFRNHSFSAQIKEGSYLNNLTDYYYIDIPFFDSLGGNNTGYGLYFELQVNSIFIDEYGVDDVGVIIDNAVDRIIESNEINKHANQENFDKLQETIKDTNISGSQGFAKDFFDNFKDDDIHGLSSIVSAPLVMINSLLSSSNISRCSNLNFEILGSSVYFPHGCTFWDKVPPTVMTLYHVIFCGFFGYILVVGLFKDVQQLKNPNSNGVKTLDL